METPSSEVLKSVEKEISKLLEPFDSMEAVDKFLEEESLKKDPITRFLAYLLKTQVISIDQKKNAKQLVDLIPEYIKTTKEYFGEDFESPLLKIAKRDRPTVEADIKRSYFLFVNSCKHYDVKDYKKYPDGKTIPSRALATLAISDDKLSYTQGYDRYFFISYALSLKFCEKVGLDFIFAEALAYYLTKPLIINASFNDLLENPGTYEGFSLLDEQIKKYCPNTYKVLSKGHLSAFNYAMRWRLLFFSDEHEIDGALLIWDYFLLHMDDTDQFFGYIGAAHVHQVEVDDDFTAVEKLQKFRDWDECKIIQDTKLMAAGKRLRSRNSGRRIFMLVSIIVLLSAAAYVYTKRFDIVSKF
ncbi:hypothetical protein TVAG_067230 [Trichomonas vaginalis G3]|uniref:Rab-GAP TBC domain-containing protein n=1 Tax=Trichomonas vaginalis (strain ATCC PRA-98 / G3) TaxID=412133 RepID=A2DSD9_TRIV3|nr:TBC domain-containing protein kinase-like protein family [Trichomonas vaginalis G3]EAY16718.1 hypothetical protein TVAG_067230 [Trichomonas vaginalis G3]KAI5543152.1 TBC domain-containing protein kinase-like protein family [Trichomonas vaginalis G3]|eukprot:XP_001328941.1 hypothetical protein [Trichomonas vaginalis G3]